jgi:hypothetical protein
MPHWETRLNGSTDAVKNAARFTWPSVHDASLKNWEDSAFKLMSQAIDLHMTAEEGGSRDYAGIADFIAWFMDVYRVLKGHGFDRIVSNHWKYSSMRSTLKILM